MLAGGRKRGDACTARCLAGDRCLRPRTKWWSTVDGADARIAASEASGHGERGPLAVLPCELTRPKRAAVVRGSAAEHPRWRGSAPRIDTSQPGGHCETVRASAAWSFILVVLPLCLICLWLVFP